MLFCIDQKAGTVEFTVSLPGAGSDDEDSSNVTGTGEQTDPFILALDGSYSAELLQQDLDTIKAKYQDLKQNQKIKP